MRADAIEMPLTYAELLTIAQQGVIRDLESIYRRREPKPGLPRTDGFDRNIRGAAGEYVVAKYLELPWHLTIGRFRQPDVGHNVHVRTNGTFTGDLILRDDDQKPDDPYVLVVGAFPVLVLVGWAFGHEVQQDRYRRDPDGNGMAWWMPQNDLRSMPALRASREEAA